MVLRPRFRPTPLPASARTRRKEVEEGKGAVVRVNFNDARRGSKQADFCDECAGKMAGKQVARRGRRPKTAAA
jgi:hypothetical protein